jgi:hypothetical protein
VNSGTRRTIGELASQTYLASGWDPRGGVRQVPLTSTTTVGRGKPAGERHRFALILVDAGNGQQELITEDSCWWDNVSVTPDARWLAYAICEPEGDGARVREIHLRDLERGEDQILAGMDRWLGRVLVSADGSTVLAASCEAGAVTEAPRTCTTSILSPDGPSLAFPVGWSPLAWAAEGQVYLGDDLNTPRRVALGSVKSGELQLIFP